MTKREIQEAYDRMSPTQEAKMRMLSNILPQKKGAVRRRAKPQKQSWFAAVPAMLALAAMLTVCFFLLRPEDSTLPLAENPTDIQASQPTELTETPEAAVPDGYIYILNKYMTAYNESWTPEQYMQNDISYPLCGMDIFTDYGYALIDLDGDGIDELIITDGEYIYDMYILMEDGGAGHILSAGERLRYFLCDDHIIGYQGSSGAANTCWEYTRLLPGGDSEIVMYLQFDTDTYYKMEGGSDKMVAITKDEAGEIINTYRSIQISFQPFLRNESAKELKYPRTYAQKLREMISENPGVADMVAAFADISGDGEEELLLGNRFADSFNQVYAVVNGQVEQVLTYGVGEGFTLCENGVICFHKPNKPLGNYTFISMKDNENRIIEHLVYSTDDSSWIREKDGMRERITDAEKQEIIDSYGSVSVEWMSVLEAIG